MYSVKQIRDIYTYLKKNYPESLPPLSEIKTYEDLIDLKLSHFQCELLNYNKNLDITNVTHVEIASEWIPINIYTKSIANLVSYTKKILLFKHPKTLPSLDPHEITKVKTHNSIRDPAYYKYDEAYPNKALKPNLENHFIITSFSIDNNADQLAAAIQRLYEIRNRYKTLHFHLEGNGGGDLIPVHLIMLCLCGRQSWMTNYEVIEMSHGIKKTRKWDPWTLSKKGSKLDISFESLPTYTTQYKGKIVIHMDKYCGSSCWYFITYLIYAFAEKIERFATYVGGKPIKLGRATGSQIELHGYCLTSAGDANAVKKAFELGDAKIMCYFPTQATVHRPVENRDWNRFWTE